MHEWRKSAERAHLELKMRHGIYCNEKNNEFDILGLYKGIHTGYGHQFRCRQGSFITSGYRRTEKCVCTRIARREQLRKERVAGDIHIA